MNVIDPYFKELYLFDWSLPLFCPELEAEFAVPKYFRRDFLKMTSSDALYRCEFLVTVEL